MNTISKTGFLWGISLLLIIGCRDNTHQAADIIARVGEAYLTKEVMYSIIPPNLQPADRRAFIRRTVDKWIDNQILAQKAREDGFALTQADRWHLENMEAEILAQRLLKGRIPERVAVTDVAIEDYYKANSIQFERGHNEVHLVHLFLEKLDKAIVQDIRQSKQLLDVIKRNDFLNQRVTGSIERNGDLGYVATSQLRSEFERAIRGTKTGVIYGPIKTSDGNHYLQVLDRQPAGSLRALSLVRNEIIPILRLRERSKLIKQYKENLRKQMVVETNDKNFL